MGMNKFFLSLKGKYFTERWHVMNMLSIYMYSHIPGNTTIHHLAARSDCFSHSNIFGEPPKCSNNPSSCLAHTGMFVGFCLCCCCIMEPKLIVFSFIEVLYTLIVVEKCSYVSFTINSSLSLSAEQCNYSPPDYHACHGRMVYDGGE